MSISFSRLGCGIDVSKDRLDVCFGGYTAAGSFKVLASRTTFKNTLSDIERLSVWLGQKLNKYQASASVSFQVVVETTGVYHELLVAQIHQAGFTVCLERAARVKKFLLSLGQLSKNDALDASGLCRLACERKLRAWQPFSPHVLELRNVLRHRNRLIKNKVRYGNQLHAVHHGGHPNRAVKKSLKQLIKQLTRQIEAVEAEMLRLYQSDEKLMAAIQPIERSFKGVGLLTLLTIFAETNGFATITSRKQLSAYAGLDVLQNQSGMSRGRGRISRRGNSNIRSILYMCALAVVQSKTGPIYRKYVRICLRNPKAKKIAVTAVQRTILELIFTLYKSGTAYDANHVWSPGRRQTAESTAKKSTPEGGSEVHGIARSEEPLPIS